MSARRSEARSDCLSRTLTTPKMPSNRILDPIAVVDSNHPHTTPPLHQAQMPRKNSANVLDVLDNSLGYDWATANIADIDDEALADLLELLDEFYDSWAMQTSATELRVFSGYHQSIAGEPLDRQSLLSDLLYFDQVVVDDPIAVLRNLKTDPFFALRYAHYPKLEGITQLVRRALQHALRDLAFLRPLIETELVLPVPASDMISRQILSPNDSLAELVQSAYDDPAFTALASVVFGKPQSAEEREAFTKFFEAVRSAIPGVDHRASPDLYLAGLLNTSTLLVADETSSLYMPSHWKWWVMLVGYLELINAQLSPTAETHLRIAQTLVKTEIPILNDLDPHLLLNIRRNEEHFSAWRADLRLGLSALRSLPGTQEFEQEAEMMLSDLVLPRAAEVRKTVGASRALRKAAKDPALGFAIGAATAVGELAGLPVSGGLATAGFTALGGWGLKVLFRDRPSGTNAILARLIRR
jgi:hypothetical protein